MRVVKLFVFAGAVWVGLSSSSCAPEGACSANGDCASGQSCLIDDDGAGRCVTASEGEGEGEGEDDVTVSLSASAEGINAGQTVTLTWSVTGTRACELRAGDLLVPDVVVDEEAVEVTPLRTTTYAMECAGVRDDVTVGVSSLQVEADVLVQQGVTMRLPLLAEELDLAACTLTGAEPAEAAIDAPESALVLTLSEPKALTIICDGLGGPVVAEVSVDIFHLDAPAVINAGDELPLTVNHTSLQGCTVRIDGVVTMPSYIGVPGGGGDVSYVMGTPLEDATYDVSCPGAAGELTASALVRVRPRIVTFDAAVSRDPDVEGLTLTVETLGGDAGDCVLARGDGVVAPASNGTTPVPLLPAGRHAHSLTCAADASDAAPVTLTLTSLWGELDLDATEALAALDGIQFLVGALEFNIDDTTDLGEALNTDSLVEVNHLRIDIPAQSDTWAFSAPALRFAAFLYTHDLSGTLTAFECPALEEAGDLGIQGPALTSIMLPALAELGILESMVTGGVAIDFPALIHADEILVGDALSFSAPLLESLQYLAIRESPSLTSFTLPGVASIEALHVTDVPALTSLSFPVLETVVRNLYVLRAPALTTLDLPALASVEQTLVLADLDSLATLDLSALTVAGLVEIVGAGPAEVHLGVLSVSELHIEGAAAEIHLPALTAAGALTLGPLPDLVTLEMAALESAGTLALDTLLGLTDANLAGLTDVEQLTLSTVVTPPSWPALESISGGVTATGPCAPVLSFPALTSVGGTVSISSPLTNTISAPELTTVGGLSLTSNVNLTQLDLPLLDAIPELYVVQNPALLCAEIIGAYCGASVQDPSPTVALNYEPQPLPAPQCNQFVTPGC